MRRKAIEIGKSIKQFRLDRDMTQANVAAYLGISRASVNKLEQGHGSISELLYAKIKRQLDRALAPQQVA